MEKLEKLEEVVVGVIGRQLERAKPTSRGERRLFLRLDEGALDEAGEIHYIPTGFSKEATVTVVHAIVHELAKAKIEVTTDEVVAIIRELVRAGKLDEMHSVWNGTRIWRVGLRGASEMVASGGSAISGAKMSSLLRDVSF